jgi:hypothetical protein
VDVWLEWNKEKKTWELPKEALDPRLTLTPIAYVEPKKSWWKRFKDWLVPDPRNQGDLL